jgi:hypothetical protein
MRVADTRIVDVTEVVIAAEEEPIEPTTFPTGTGNEAKRSTRKMVVTATVTIGTTEVLEVATEETTTEGITFEADTEGTTSIRIEADSTTTVVIEEDTMTATTSGEITEGTAFEITIAATTPGEVAVILQTIVSHSRTETATLGIPVMPAWITVAVVDMAEGTITRTSTRRDGSNDELPPS